MGMVENKKKLGRKDYEKTWTRKVYQIVLLALFHPIERKFIQLLLMISSFKIRLLKTV
jgi:hypothetical protein